MVVGSVFNGIEYLYKSCVIKNYCGAIQIFQEMRVLDMFCIIE
jgi:hypothetical protein